MALEFTTKKRSTEPFTFTLDDRSYEFTPPKNAVLALAFMEAQSSGEDALMLRALFDYLDAGLSRKDAELIVNRLKDPDDDLDLDTLGAVVEGLVTESAERPTK